MELTSIEENMKQNKNIDPNNSNNFYSGNIKCSLIPNDHLFIFY